MKFGFKTRTWGIRIDNIREVLDTIALAGYQGVEFSQRPEALGCNDIRELCKLLGERGLVLLNLTRGTLQERVRYLDGFRPQYLSVKHWDLPGISELIQQKITPAFHPGMFSPIKRVSDILSKLEGHPELEALRIICDTAHITIAGDDLIETILGVKDRLAAIHLKDWTPEFGRAGPRYARGFTELGEGIVKLDELLQKLRSQQHEGWIVVEIESANTQPTEAVFNSVAWLVNKGLITQTPGQPSRSVDKKVQRVPSPGHKHSLEAKAQFSQTIMLSTMKDVEAFYSDLAQALHELLPCDLIRIWTCSPVQDQLGLLCSTGTIPIDNQSKMILKLCEGLTGIAIDRQASATHFDLTLKHPGAEYGFPDRVFESPYLLSYRDIKSMISVPIYNSDHRNYAKLVLNLFPEDTSIQLNDDDFHWLSQIVSIATDIVLDRACAMATAKVNILAAGSEDVNAFLEKLVRFMQVPLKCFGVAIFLVNTAGDKLELKASTGTTWHVGDETYYRKGEGITGGVWERNEPFFKTSSLRGAGHVRKSDEGGSTSRQHACLWVPLVNSKRQVVGVLRCSNKRIPVDTFALDMFSDEDAAILDAIGQAVSPHLHVLLEEAKRKKALGRLTHELASPLASIRGAANLLTNIPGLQKFLPYDYPGDIWSWSDLMRRLLINADIFRISSGFIPIRPTPTLLMAEVIAPAVKQAKVLLEERSFSYNRIRYGAFEQVPKLYIDQNMFQQVIFNLLSNAIKYSFKDPNAFQVEIEGEKTSSGFAIFFRNWGRGIDIELKEKIFEEEYRTPEATGLNITGQGLGLWVVRRIVNAHGGNICLTNANMPTEFTILLPEWLVKQPPIAQSQKRKKK